MTEIDANFGVWDESVLATVAEHCDTLMDMQSDPDIPDQMASTTFGFNIQAVVEEHGLDPDDAGGLVAAGVLYSKGVLQDAAQTRAEVDSAFDE